MAKSIGFLSLPRELRQKILNHTFDDPTEQDIGLCSNLKLLATIGGNDEGTEYVRNKSHKHVSAPHLHAWASTLALVHEIVGEDLPFVLNRHLMILEIDTFNFYLLAEQRVYVRGGACYTLSKYDRWDKAINYRRKKARAFAKVLATHRELREMIGLPRLDEPNAWFR